MFTPATHVSCGGGGEGVGGSGGGGGLGFGGGNGGMNGLVETMAIASASA